MTDALTWALTVKQGRARGFAENVQAIAEVEGSTVSDVIRNALGEHVGRRKADPESRSC